VQVEIWPIDPARPPLLVTLPLRTFAQAVCSYWHRALSYSLTLCFHNESATHRLVHAANSQSWTWACHLGSRLGV